jgi:CDGSH-type Zn-finger protein
MSNRIKCNKNGPLLIQGDFELTDAEGKPYDLGGRTQIALCRCGASENKPFCDGAHNKVGFQSQPVAVVLPPK